MDNGEWHDDFDIAVTGAELEDEEASLLLNSLLRAYPHYVIDVDILKAIIEEHLPQAQLTPIIWLIGPDLALVITDSLRVAKVKFSDFVWVTKRISWDGILLDKIEDNIIFGSWYDAPSESSEWQPLRLSYIDGSLIEGEELDF